MLNNKGDIQTKYSKQSASNEVWISVQGVLKVLSDDITWSKTQNNLCDLNELQCRQ